MLTLLSFIVMVTNSSGGVVIDLQLGDQLALDLLTLKNWLKKEKKCEYRGRAPKLQCIYQHSLYSFD